MKRAQFFIDGGGEDTVDYIVTLSQDSIGAVYVKLTVKGETSPRYTLMKLTSEGITRYGGMSTERSGFSVDYNGAMAMVR